jgi:hypothetical protein
VGTGGSSGWGSVGFAVAGGEGFEFCSNAIFELFFGLIGGAGYDCKNGYMRFANWGGIVLGGSLVLVSRVTRTEFAVFLGPSHISLNFSLYQTFDWQTR